MAVPSMVRAAMFPPMTRRQVRWRWRFYTVPGKPGTADGAASDKALAKLARFPVGAGEEPSGIRSPMIPKPTFFSLV